MSSATEGFPHFKPVIDDGAPLHERYAAQDSQEAIAELEEENFHIDDVVREFSATGNPDQDTIALYRLLRLNRNDSVGGLTPEQTRRFYSTALNDRAAGIEAIDPDKAAAIRLLAHYFSSAPEKIAELKEKTI